MILLKPTTQYGKWSIRLLAGFITFFGLFWLAIIAGERGGEDFFSNMWLTLPFLAAAVVATAALIAGMTAIIKTKERSITVYLAVLIGLLVTFFWLAEIMFPH